MRFFSRRPLCFFRTDRLATLGAEQCDRREYLFCVFFFPPTHVRSETAQRPRGRRALLGRGIGWRVTRRGRLYAGSIKCARTRLSGGEDDRKDKSGGGNIATFFRLVPTRLSAFFLFTANGHGTTWTTVFKSYVFIFHDLYIHIFFVCPFTTNTC